MTTQKEKSVANTGKNRNGTVSSRSRKRQNAANKQSSASVSYSRRKRHVKKQRLGLLLLCLLLFIGCIFLLHQHFSRKVQGTLTGVSNDVLQYRSAVEQACKDAGISQFSILMLAIMQQESSGLGTDVLQCSECPFNTEYDNTPNAISDPYYSIEVGTQYFAYCLEEAGCKRIQDTDRLKLALQSYNYGNGYAKWALSNYGSYSSENAMEFSLNMQYTLGWSSYGDPDYVEHVLRYYNMP